MIISWTHENNNTHWSEELRFVQFKKKTRSYHRTIDQSPYSVLFGSDMKVGLPSSAIQKEILNTLETEEDLNALTTTETPTNRNDTNQTTPEADTDIETETNTEPETETNTEPETETNTEPETEINTEPETETNAEPETETNTEPETGTNTATDAHFDIDTNSETEPEIVSDVNMNIVQESTDRTVIYDKIVRARKRALSGQQIQAEEMMSSSKRRLVDLKVNDNIIIPVPRVDRGPIECKNIRGIIVDKTVNGYKIGTTVGVISGPLSRNQIEKIHGHELTILDVPDNIEISVRKAVQLLSLYGGQGHIHCSCRSGRKTGKCKCKRRNILCNSRCHASLSCANKCILVQNNNMTYQLFLLFKITSLGQWLSYLYFRA